MPANSLEELRTLVHLSGEYLDCFQFHDYAALYSTNGSYTLKVRSPELTAPMDWMHFRKSEIGELEDRVKQHEWDLGERTHLISVTQLDLKGDRASVSSTFSVFRVNGEGRLEVYAVGRYHDMWRDSGTGWLLAQRTAWLSNRLLTSSTPIPL